MPITNLAIQRRRLSELWDLSLERNLELFSVQIANNYYDGRKMKWGYETFIIHARKITPEIANRLKDIGFKIESVEPMNDYTLILKVRKNPPERKP